MVQQSSLKFSSGVNHGVSPRCCCTDDKPSRRRKRTGAFYIGLSQGETGWEPAMLRGVSRGEVQHLEECGRALIGNPLSASSQ